MRLKGTWASACPADNIMIDNIMADNILADGILVDDILADDILADDILADRKNCAVDLICWLPRQRVHADWPDRPPSPAGRLRSIWF